MVKAYEGKLSEFLIPVEELGFDPLVPNNAEWFLQIIYFCLLYIFINSLNILISKFLQFKF